MLPIRSLNVDMQGNKIIPLNALHLKHIQENGKNLGFNHAELQENATSVEVEFSQRE